MGSEVDKKRESVEGALAKGNGILRLEPAWVARDFLPPGRRLGLKEEEYEVGERGWISERWIGSTTRADNRIGPPDEGLSYITLEGDERITLREAVEGAWLRSTTSPPGYLTTFTSARKMRHWSGATRKRKLTTSPRT
jgi:hypothetical protein